MLDHPCTKLQPPPPFVPPTNTHEHTQYTSKHTSYTSKHMDQSPSHMYQSNNMHQSTPYMHQSTAISHSYSHSVAPHVGHITLGCTALRIRPFPSATRRLGGPDLVSGLTHKLRSKSNFSWTQMAFVHYRSENVPGGATKKQNKNSGEVV